MLIVNTTTIAHKAIMENLGLVQGCTVQTKHLGHDIVAGLKTLIGGELRGYTELLEDARNEALARMTDRARALGANAVVNVRFTTSAISSTASEILAYGTAVRTD